MAQIKTDGNYNAIPISYKRGNPIPLDTTSVWYSDAEAQAYAKSDLAYVGQIISVVNESSVDVYKIANTDGTLQLVGQNHEGSGAIEVTPQGNNKQISLKLNNTDAADGYTTVELTQDADDGLHAKLDLSGYKTVQTAVEDKITNKAHVIDSLTQDTKGKISYTVKALAPADIGAQPAGNYKTKTTEEKTDTGATSKTIISLSQSTNGDITATFTDIQIETSQINNLTEGLQLNSEYLTLTEPDKALTLSNDFITSINTISNNVAGLQTGKVDKQEGYSLISSLDQEKLNALDLTDGTITIPTQIATKSIVDLESYLDSKLCTKVGTVTTPLLEESIKDGQPAYQPIGVTFDNLYLRENLRYLLKITYILDDETYTESYFGTAEPSIVGAEGVIDLLIEKETNENRAGVNGATVFQISSFDYEVVDSAVCPGLTQDTTFLYLTIPGYGGDFEADIFSDYAKYLNDCTIELFEAPENAVIDTYNDKFMSQARMEFLVI
jgi:hypothetical protein